MSLGTSLCHLCFIYDSLMACRRWSWRNVIVLRNKSWVWSQTFQTLLTICSALTRFSCTYFNLRNTAPNTLVTQKNLLSKNVKITYRFLDFSNNHSDYLQEVTILRKWLCCCYGDSGGTSKSTCQGTSCEHNTPMRPNQEVQSPFNKPETKGGRLVVEDGHVQITSRTTLAF